MNDLIEKETIIVFNEGEENALVTTFNKRLVKQLKELCLQRPEECRSEDDYPYGGEHYIVPKSWVKIVPNRVISEQQRDKMRKRFFNNVQNAHL